VPPEILERHVPSAARGEVANRVLGSANDIRSASRARHHEPPSADRHADVV